MVADSVPARRPAHPDAVRGLRRRVRASAGVVLIGLLAGVLPVASAALLPAFPVLAGLTTGAHAAGSPASPAATSADSVAISVTPTTLAPLKMGQDLAVTVTITNPTVDPIAPGTLDVYLAERALITRGALEKWLHPEKSTRPGDLLMSEAMKVSIQPDSTEVLTLTVPADSVGLTTGNAWGARGIAVTLSTEGTTRAQGRGTFVWYSDEEVTPVNLSVVMPITVPEQSTGLITAKALESFTGPTGVLTRQLDGVIGRPVTLAIDPMIIASIRILGTSAPPSATAWLNRLALARNDIFPLSYADTDIALQAQAGGDTLLAPTSFDQAIDPTLFTQPPTPAQTTPADQTPQNQAPATAPAQTPPASPADGTPPTTEELLAWEYTATDIAWPAEGVVADADLGTFTANGLTTTILTGSNVSHQATDLTPNSVVALGAGRGVGLVSDGPVSDSLRRAALATTDEAWSVAMAEVSSQLAVVSAEQPGTARTLVATFGRGWPPTSARLSQTLDALTVLLWHSPASLQDARSAAAADDVTFDSQAEPDDRVNLARRLLERESDVTAFSSALSDPGAVTGGHRLDLMALLATSWASHRASWLDASTTSLLASSDLLSSITVSTKGPINVVGSKVDIPVTLDNALDQAVTVRVQVVPSNGRLLVEDDVESTIEAESARTVTIPVTAAVGNGSVTLRVTLFTPAGSMIDQPHLIPINVRADWEGLGSLLFAALVVLFFGFGVWRNIVRRRRELIEPDVEVDPAAIRGAASEPTTEPRA
ncbi:MULTISPECIES: DUF6049 family protein [unclassified Cryobacterium]|uniref:DUF6049 family protein n=1 Tax=unclassified Cryobacterium TaxID=2649013 RepID=UPI00141B226C|nr:MULTISPECIES: DUF6049 family protein [unclassified Cryobacterium]